MNRTRDGDCTVRYCPHNQLMPRRVHVQSLRLGELLLSESESHHLRDVLRAQLNDQVELFDPTGQTALATITELSAKGLKVRITEVQKAVPTSQITIASALPKGDRADWMIEKLSELGVWRFIPLQTERSVVHPEGKNKFERWTRIATEAAKQSRRTGIMQIDPLTPLAALLPKLQSALYLSPDPQASSLSSILYPLSSRSLLIGPEGGWSDEEIALFTSRNIAPARLTDTILRIETAAITAAALAACASIRPPSI
jgi:16S rRNA (uracil1498-N3)-methyltransferase